MRLCHQVIPGPRPSRLSAARPKRTWPEGAGRACDDRGPASRSAVVSANAECACSKDRATVGMRLLSCGDKTGSIRSGAGEIRGSTGGHLALEIHYDCFKAEQSWHLRNFLLTEMRPILTSQLVDKLDDRADADHLRKLRGVPIGQAHATMALGLADLGRIRRTMDAIGWLRQSDPDRADRPVRPGCRVSTLSLLPCLKLIFGL